MLRRALTSKAAFWRPVLLARPGLAPAISLACLLPLGARGQTGRAGGESEEAARAAAHDLSEAARDSVKHASEGDVGATVQDAARMAQAGARGAAQAARLIFEKVTGLNTSSGYEGSVGDRAATAATDTASAATDAASRTMDSASDAATAAYNQTVGSMSGTTFPEGSKGPESTYHENVLKGGGLGGPTGDWAGVMVQSAVDEAGATGGEDLAASPKGSGAGGAGFAGPGSGAGGVAGGTSERSFVEDEFAVEGGDKSVLSSAAGGTEGGGRGGSGGVQHTSERSAQDDEFAVTRGP